MGWIFGWELAMANWTAERCAQELRGRLQSFYAAERGNIAMTFSLMLIPLMTGVGAAVDYSRANAAKSSLQTALDSALLAGAKDGSSSWATTAQNVFASNLAPKHISATTPSFTSPETSTYTASTSASIVTSTLGIIGIHSISVTANATAKAAEADNSCILTLDKGAAPSHVALQLNGAPVVNLAGCSIRSNTSVDCNGHDGNVTKSYAGGTASDCGRPTSHAPIVPDIFADMATNITTECGGARYNNDTWTPGSMPVGPGIKTVNKSGYVEYHVCGDLTVSGTGFLTGNPPASDVVIVIENGSLKVADDANISTSRTAIVMTGNNSWPAKVDFPNGNGKQGKLALSPPTGTGNPWQAVALYL